MDQFKLNQTTLIELLNQVDSGVLKLPDFQRSYNWKSPKVKKLLDSIHKKHPAGSLLFLEVDPNNPLISERTFESAAQENNKPTENLVLDGQQRLTSCYYAFYNKGNYSYYLDMKEIYIRYKSNELNDLDIDDSGIVICKKHIDFPTGELNNDYFPFGCFSSRETFKRTISEYKRALRSKSTDDDYYTFIDEYFELYCNSFFDYQFPIIELPKELSLDAVCKVFQTINTTGLKLSAFDICVAKFTRFSIYLKTKIDDAIEKYPNIEVIANKDKTIILQAVALLCNINPKMSGLPDSLDESSFLKWDKAVHGLNIAIDMLNRFGAGCEKNLSLLPYQPFIALFGATIAESEYWNLNAMKQAAIENKLKFFFYHASLDARYSEGTDNKMKEDFNKLCSWIDTNKKPEYLQQGVNWNKTKFISAKKGSAMGKVILCLINSKFPKDFYNETSVGIGPGRENSDIHHLFPKAAYSGLYGNAIESVFNQTYITPKTNKHIRDKSTHTYIDEIINHNATMTSTALKSKLETHFIDDKAYQALYNEEFNNFIKFREENIRHELEQSIGLTINLVDDSSDDSANDEEFSDSDE